MATAAAMVWSGSRVIIINCRRRRPHWTDVASWCQGITVITLVTFILGVVYTKWPLFWCRCNNSTAPLMNRGPSGRKHSPITSQFDRSDDETIVDEPAPFQSVRNRRHETAWLFNDAACMLSHIYGTTYKREGCGDTTTNRVRRCLHHDNIMISMDRVASRLYVVRFR